MQKKIKSLVSTVLKVLVAAGIIYWLSHQGKLNFLALKNLLQPGPFILSLVMMSASFFITTERWRVLLSTQGLSVKTWPLIKLTMIGVFFNFAIPGGVGGDIVKAYYFYRDHSQSKSVALSSVMVDRILGLHTMIVMAVAVMIYDFNHVTTVPVLNHLFYFFFALLVAFSIVLFLLFTKKSKVQKPILRMIEHLPKKEKFAKLYQSTQLYGNSLKKLSLVAFLSLLSQATSIFFLVLAGEVSGLASGVPWSVYFLVAPLGFMATAIPISPAGIGVGQVAFMYLFNIYLGQTSDLGPTTITALQLFQLLFGLSGVYFYLMRKDKSTAHIQDIAEDTQNSINSVPKSI